MAPRDWRRAADYADIAGMDLSALAWEFLRRNPRYREEYPGLVDAAEAGAAEALAGRWGLRFPVSPDLDADAGPVFWRAEAAPAHVVILAPSALGGLTVADLAARSAAGHRADDGVHLRLGRGLQAVVPPDAGPAAPLAAAAPLDAVLGVRLTALAALDRLLDGRPAGPDPLPPLSRRRLGGMLRALDGRAAGASHRDIALHLVGGVPAEPGAWRTCAARDVAVRLCRSAVRVVEGGYRRLLARRR
ncbi:DUF2285 domain-containing protein [Phenylobacterium sp.]|uniref:DUF2285 domain-containing protein n=1 Tax=Phenylobacterium sp. TaxID=1871053 RepID=UPI002FE3F0EA